MTVCLVPARSLTVTGRNFTTVAAWCLAGLPVFVTAVSEYKASLRELGQVWRTHFGRHYPAMGLFGVTELFDPAARVELMGVAVVAPRDT